MVKEVEKTGQFFERSPFRKKCYIAAIWS